MLDACLDRKNCVIYGRPTNQLKYNHTELKYLESRSELQESCQWVLCMAVLGRRLPKAESGEKSLLDGLISSNGVLDDTPLLQRAMVKYKHRKFIILETKEKIKVSSFWRYHRGISMKRESCIFSQKRHVVDIQTENRAHCWAIPVLLALLFSLAISVILKI